MTKAARGSRANWRWTAIAGSVLALCLITSVSAASITLGPLVRVSGASPFATCAADNLAGQDGSPVLDSEVEPWVDVNPTNPNNVVGIWQQDRFTNGGSRGLVVGRSTNGGRNWTTVTSVKTSLCTGGTAGNGGGYQRATDPWVTFGPTGVLYQLSLSFNNPLPPLTSFAFDHALLASRSTDGGLTWSNPVRVIRDTASTVFNDKQSITADPTNASHVYGVWSRYVFPSERGSMNAAFHAAAYRGPVWFARSTDAGVTWEPAHEIYDPGQNDETTGNQIVVLPNGELVDIFTEFNGDNARPGRGGIVRVLRSTDKGVTWSGPFDVGRMDAIGVTDPETGDAVRTADGTPEVAVDQAGGRLYATWQNASLNGGAAEGIAFSRSLDGGRTWSAAVEVNRTPTAIPSGNQQAFTPSVDVSADGTIAVTYYDLRNNTSAAPTLPTDYFVVHCHPTSVAACLDRSAWTEQSLTNTSFDMRLAPIAGGFFTGDYEGLAHAGNAFGALFSQSHGTDPASVFFRRVG